MFRSYLLPLAEGWQSAPGGFWHNWEEEKCKWYNAVCWNFGQSEHLNNLVQDPSHLPPSTDVIGSNCLGTSNSTDTFLTADYLCIHLNQIQSPWTWKQNIPLKCHNKTLLCGTQTRRNNNYLKNWQEILKPNMTGHVHNWQFLLNM